MERYIIIQSRVTNVYDIFIINRVTQKLRIFCVFPAYPGVQTNFYS